MKIAIADMAGERRGDRRLAEVGFRLGNAFGKPRDRHADIGGPALRPRAQRQRGVVGVVPRLPQLGAVLLRGRPAKTGPAELAGDLLYQRDLLGGAVDSAVKFKEQRRRNLMIEL